MVERSFVVDREFRTRTGQILSKDVHFCDKFLKYGYEKSWTVRTDKLTF